MWRALVENAEGIVVCFTGNHIEVLLVQMDMFLLQIQELRNAAAVVDQHQDDLIVRIL